MKLSRKEFLGSLGAGAALLSTPSFSANGNGAGPLLKLALFSDTHVANAHDQEMVRKIFEFAKANGVDGVLAAGDLVSDGRISQLKLVADAWFSVFPGSKNANGEKVEFISCYGNRELECRHMPMSKDGSGPSADAIGRAPDAAWYDLFGEHIGDRFCVRSVKGYPVIAVHWGAERDIAGHWDKLTAGTDLSKTFFYIQHPHLSGTVFNGMKADSGEATALLSKYPGAIALSGHSHRSISDERALWHGSFLSVAGGAGGVVRPFTAGRLYENIGRLGARRNQPMPRIPHMPETAQIDGLCQVMILSLFPDRVEIVRHDCGIGEKAGPDWIVPHPCDGAKKTGLNREAPPQFPEGAKIEVFEREGVNRNGEKESQIAVSFPPARPYSAVRGRVCDYEVSAMHPDGTRIVTQYVLSENYFAPFRRISGNVECVFARDSIPPGVKPVWSVTPFGFGGEDWESKGSVLYYSQR